MPQLRSLISEAVHSGAAVRERLAADLDSVGADLAAGQSATRELDRLPCKGSRRSSSRWAQAAGVPPVLDAVEEDYRRGALAAGGWPVTRWLVALRPDPLRRLRLGSRGGGADGSDEADGNDASLEAELRRTSLPAPTPAQRARVSLATTAARRRGGGRPARLVG